MRTKLFAISVLVCCCSCVTTPEPIIEKGSDFDFGLVGKWIGIPDPKDPFAGKIDRRKIAPAPNDSIEVSRDADDPTRYLAICRWNEQEASFRFTTACLSEQTNTALIQVSDPNSKFSSGFQYAVATVREGRLYLSHLHKDKWIACIKREKLSAVIDRSLGSAEINAEAAGMLDLIRKHHREIASEPKIFRQATAGE